MKRFYFILGLLIAVTLPSLSNSQTFERRVDSSGNWKIHAANDGSMFNNNNIVGALWKDRGLIFGAGLWVGGKMEAFNRLNKTMTMSYNPNSGSSDFVPGSIESGYRRDITYQSSANYGMRLSGGTPPDEWPIRNTDYGSMFVTDISSRPSVGPPYYIGDEDMYFMYKNTDTSATLSLKPTDLRAQFDVQTQVGMFSQGLGMDVIVVKNKLIYVSNDTLFDPAVALAIDADIESTGNCDFGGKLSILSNDNVSGFFFSSDCKDNGKPLPLLGIYLLRGAGSPDKGATTLKRWTLSNDPPTKELRYDFMTSKQIDTGNITGGVIGDMRGLMASEPGYNLKRGDTLFFDYALFAYQPSNAKPNDTAAMIETGKIITDLYKSGNLDSIRKIIPLSMHNPKGSVQNQSSVFPNPASSLCTFHAKGATINNIDIFNMLGQRLLAKTIPGGIERVEVDMKDLPIGVYQVVINSQDVLKMIKE
ncbi:MAG TPA: T9SS type A sorting domain-containing protein [Candidatus Kapabacteria bacterium]